VTEAYLVSYYKREPILHSWCDK